MSVMFFFSCNGICAVTTMLFLLLKPELEELGFRALVNLSAYPYAEVNVILFLISTALCPTPSPQQRQSKTSTIIFQCTILNPEMQLQDLGNHDDLLPPHSCRSSLLLVSMLASDCATRGTPQSSRAAAQRLLHINPCRVFIR